MRTRAGSNAYTVDLSETWTVQRDCVFESAEEAEAYVVLKNKQAIDGDVYIRLSARYTDSEFLGSRSPYPKYLTYFVGTPPLRIIQQQLKDDGVRIL
jgi:hypothetical protein